MTRVPEEDPSGSPDSKLDALLESFIERFRKGDRPSVTEYAALNPGLASRIRELFPGLELLEELDREDAARTSPAGARLGEYRLLREVGRGGMGVVYEAVQESLGRRVALKVLPFTDRTDGRARERFQREARAAAGLDHPHIVPVYGLGEDRGLSFYAMKFVEGESLDLVLREVKRITTSGEMRPPGVTPDESPRSTSLALGLLCGRSDLPASPLQGPPWLGDSGLASLWEGAPPDRREYQRRAARIGREAAEGLAYAHGRGVLHRDIKPSNILLDVEGRAWIADFGLAKAAGAQSLTRSGELLGTLRYLAPEAFRGKGDERSDVYGLGLTLYEMLTLEPAFPGEDRGDLLRRVAEEEPKPPRRLVPSIPPPLEAIVLQAIRKDCRERYGSAAALAEDLGRFLDGSSVRARRPGPAARLLRRVRRHPFLLGGLVLAAGIAAAATWALLPSPVLLPSDLLLRDLDGDGDLDLALTASQGHESDEPGFLFLFENRGSSTFRGAGRITLGVLPLSFALADLDGDGDLDFAVSNQKLKEVAVLLKERGSYVPGKKVVFENYTMRLTAADFDGDGSVDLATLVLRSNNAYLLRNRGDGSFFERTLHPVGAGPDHIGSADLDGDGRPDIVTSNILGKSLSFLRNAGGGRFSPAVHLDVGQQTQEFTAADLDGDGDLDLAVTYYGASGFSVFRNGGDAAFSRAESYPLPALTQSLSAGDFDRDGDLDLAGVGDQGFVCLIPNRGDGTFGEPTRLLEGNRPAVVRAGDMDGDGDLDLAVTNWGFLRVLRNDGKGSFQKAVDLNLPGRTY